MKRRYAVVAMTAAALVGGVILAPSVSAKTNYTVGQFNMAGGNAKHGSKGNESPDALLSSVLDRRPVFVTIQEACRDWMDRLDARLSQYTVAFNTVLAGKNGPTAKCRHNSQFGNAILYRNDLGFAGPGTPHDLHTWQVKKGSGFEQREMLCIAAQRTKLAVCSVHLTNGNDRDHLNARRHEAGEARTVIANSYRGYTTFVGGDFNDDPLSAVADNFYHPDYRRGARGGFKEVDSPCGNTMAERRGIQYCRSGEKTIGSGKIDYLFVRPSVHVSWADVTSAKHSDHRILWAGIAV